MPHGTVTAALLASLWLTACSGLPSEENTIPPTTSARHAVVVRALGQLGQAYAPHAAGPDAFDASGLTYYAYRKAGDARLARGVGAQLDAGDPITLGRAEPGDLLFFKIEASGGAPRMTVGLYTRPGYMIIAAPDASTDAAGVRMVSIEQDYWQTRLVGVIRILPARAASAGAKPT